MCGIAGYIGEAPVDKPIILKTLDLMRNRGPDNRDYVSFNLGDANVVLLHSRLSIMNLDETANQTFTIGDCTIVFDGEIYNYIELRDELARKESLSGPKRIPRFSSNTMSYMARSASSILKVCGALQSMTVVMPRAAFSGAVLLKKVAENGNDSEAFERRARKWLRK